MTHPARDKREGTGGARAGDLLRRLGGFAWRHRWAAVPALVSTLALQLLVFASLKAQGLAIDTIRRAFTGDESLVVRWPAGLEPPSSWSASRTVFVIALAVLALGLLAGVARYATRVLEEHFVQSCIVDLRTRLYERLQRLGFGFFDSHDSGQIINRITTDAQSVRAFIQGVMIRGLISIITLAVFLAFMLREHAPLALACLAVMPVQLLVMIRFTNRNKPRFLEQMRLVDVLVRTLQESIAGVRVIRAFGREREMTDRFDADAGVARDHRLAIAVERGLHIPVIQAGNYMTLAVLIGYGGLLVVRGEPAGGIALGTLWVFKGLVERIGAQAEALVWLVGGAAEAMAGAERVFGLLEHPVEIDGDETGPDARRFAAREITGRVEMRGVRFSYVPGVEAVSDVSIVAEPGQTIAIVGPTGSGKSTLLALLARFYDPDAGRVLIDGVDIRTIHPGLVRSNIAYVGQNPFLFSTSIRANIAFGDPGATMDAIERSAIDARADAFIRETDDAYDTIVGERGISLSGGQRQRLTIARALLVDAPILVLDDATGAVDPVTETEIQRALDERRHARTTFIVAHRLSTLRRADRIYVLEGGRIVDEGSHDELLGREGHYRAGALIQLALEEGTA